MKYDDGLTPSPFNRRTSASTTFSSPNLINCSGRVAHCSPRSAQKGKMGSRRGLRTELRPSTPPRLPAWRGKMLSAAQISVKRDPDGSGPQTNGWEIDSNRSEFDPQASLLICKILKWAAISLHCGRGNRESFLTPNLTRGSIPLMLDQNRRRLTLLRGEQTLELGKP